MDAGALADAGCYLSDVDVEAAILALQHSFIVNNYGNSSKTIKYSINQFGATAENFFELFGYFTGNGTLSSGYNAVSTWDNRFGFLGPPAYLKTGTQSNAPYWNITSTDVVQGSRAPTARPMRCGRRSPTSRWGRWLAPTPRSTTSSRACPSRSLGGW